MKKLLTALGLLFVSTALAQTTFVGYTPFGVKQNVTLSDTYAQNVVQISGSVVSGNCPEFSGTTGTLIDTGVPCGSGGGGGVSSVALALPGSVFSISGSPVTSSGILTGTFVTQSANTIFAGPVSGSAAVPAFRTSVLADLPSIANNTLLGNQSGGTAAPSALSALTFALADSASFQAPLYTGTAGSGNINLGDVAGDNGVTVVPGVGNVAAIIQPDTVLTFGAGLGLTIQGITATGSGTHATGGPVNILGGGGSGPSGQGGPVHITAGPTSGAFASAPAIIQGGTAGATQVGGTAELLGGLGGATSGAGGNTLLQPGSPVGGAGNGWNQINGGVTVGSFAGALPTGGNEGDGTINVTGGFYVNGVLITTGAGTVTSVAQSVPSSLLTISGSPITTNGTLALGLTNAAANSLWGNNTGSAAAPSYQTSFNISGTGTASVLESPLHSGTTAGAPVVLNSPSGTYNGLEVAPELTSSAVGVILTPITTATSGDSLDLNLFAETATTAGNGGAVQYEAGGGFGTGTGGNALVVAGPGGATGPGGAALLQGGAGGATNGNAGGATVSGGNAVGTNEAGGNLTLEGGTSTGSGAASLIQVNTGMVLGVPTGGNKGGGTINAATNLYVNNSPVCTVASGCSGTAFTIVGPGVAALNTSTTATPTALGVVGAPLTFALVDSNSFESPLYTANTASGNVTVSAGNGVGSGTAGLLSLLSGNGGTTSAGSPIVLESGNGGSTSGGSGNIDLVLGSVTSGSLGGVYIYATAGVDTGFNLQPALAGGVPTINNYNAGGITNGVQLGLAFSATAASGAGNGGGLTFNLGAGNGSGTGGAYTVNGAAGGATGAGSAISLNAGSGGSTSGNGGNITLTAGGKTSGAEGLIQLTGAGSFNGLMVTPGASTSNAVTLSPESFSATNANDLSLSLRGNNNASGIGGSVFITTGSGSASNGGSLGITVATGGSATINGSAICTVASGCGGGGSFTMTGPGIAAINGAGPSTPSTGIGNATTPLTFPMYDSNSVLTPLLESSTALGTVGIGGNHGGTFTNLTVTPGTLASATATLSAALSSGAGAANLILSPGGSGGSFGSVAVAANSFVSGNGYLFQVDQGAFPSCPMFGVGISGGTGAVDLGFNCSSGGLTSGLIRLNAYDVASATTHTNMLGGTTGPQVSSCGSGGTVNVSNGTLAFEVTTGTGSFTSCSISTSGTASNNVATTGWACDAHLLTTTRTTSLFVDETATTTSLITFTSFGTTGLAANFPVSTKMVVKCMAL